MVYIVSKKGKPLMPTNRYKHVRELLSSGKAVPICNNPFTIKLKYDTDNITQPLTLGIDVGRENIGLCVSDENGEAVFLANVQTNNKQVTKNMQERAGHRSARRSHKRQKKQRKAFQTKTTIQNGEDAILRNKKNCKAVSVSYPGMEECIQHKAIKGKEAKFNNRHREEDWITPSARNLVQIHVNLVKKLQKFLPITNVVIEHNVFNFQKLENVDIKNWQYQKGILYGFKDYKDYINKQQGGVCLLCGKHHISHHHHIIPRSKNGSDTVANIVGLCDECHDLVHKDESYVLDLQSKKAGIRKQYKISLLNSCMSLIIEEINTILPVTCCSGYETNVTRSRLHLTKDHSIDAYCISIYNKPAVTTASIKSKTYNIKHFKKKCNNIILQLNTRQYFYNNKLVATNRNKAIEQKEPSLKEYKETYLTTHSFKEWDKHFHELEIKPAKRTYTFHKDGLIAKFKCGDIVKYYKKNKINKQEKSFVFIAQCVKQKEEIIRYNETKSAKMKFCTRLQSNSLEFV